MTKVQVTFTLTRPLADADWVSISHLHSVYGFHMVRVKPSGTELFVEYDASRLSRKEVQGSLAQNGLPIGDVEQPANPGVLPPPDVTEKPSSAV